MTSKSIHHRRAGIYIMVLAFSLIVAVIGVAGMAAVRIERRFAEGDNDVTQARLHARSAIELGMFWMSQEQNWRTKFPNAGWAGEQPLGDGSLSLEALDPLDGDLSDDPADPVILIGTGTSGQARHRAQVRLVREIAPLTCLRSALHAGNDLVFSSANLSCNQTISTNDIVNTAVSTIDSDVEAVNAINGAGYTGSTTTGITPRTMPDESAFDFYVANGTTIPLLALPEDADGGFLIGGVLLSPVNNPFGLPNPLGIYVINADGEDIIIRDSFVVGTLVVLDTGSGSAVEGSVHFRPAVVNFPSLLVRGRMNFDFTTAPLDEAQVNVNFNPVGTEDPLLGGNDTMVDVFPSVISGLVYVSDRVFIGERSADASVTFDGVVVVGERLEAMGAINLNFRSRFYADPPPGFSSPARMKIVRGSWRQVIK